jgi:hypothetical protein
MPIMVAGCLGKKYILPKMLPPKIPKKVMVGLG